MYVKMHSGAYMHAYLLQPRALLLKCWCLQWLDGWIVFKACGHHPGPNWYLLLPWRWGLSLKRTTEIRVWVTNGATQLVIFSILSHHKSSILVRWFWPVHICKQVKIASLHTCAVQSLCWPCSIGFATAQIDRFSCSKYRYRDGSQDWGALDRNLYHLSVVPIWQPMLHLTPVF